MKSIKIQLIIFIFIAACSASFAQNQNKVEHRIDSLITTLPDFNKDTNKVKVLIELSALNYNINPDDGILYGKQALQLADSLKWAKGSALANNKIGINYWAKTDYTTALDYCFISLKILETLNDKTDLATILSNIGLVYSSQNSYPNAIKYDFEALKIFEEAKNKQGLAKTLGNIGTFYSEMANYPNALEYYFKALKISEELIDNQLIATNLNNIGAIFKYQGDYKKALEYTQKAKTIFDELGDNNGMAMIFRNIGLLYTLQKKYPEAIENYFSALYLYEKQDDKNGIATNLGDIGNNYLDECNYLEALKYEFKALNLCKELGIKDGIATDIGTIAATYLAIAKDTLKKVKPDALVPNTKAAVLQKAIDYYTQALKIAEEINFKDALIFCREGLAESYRLKGDYKAAFLNYKQFVANRDSVYSTQNKVLISNLETRRDLELKDKDIEIKDKQIVIDKLEVAKKRNERIYFMIGIALLVLIIIFIFRGYKKQKISNQLLNTEKQKSDELLLNILPYEVAEELKEKGKADAKFFDNVTVLLTDFKGFTIVAQKMTTQQLVTELDTCFKAFDEIIGKYNIEKIKTVGDAYLAVSGLPNADNRHAWKMVSAAIEINKYIAQRKKEKGELAFDIRIGVHSGSVVAGIVGLKKFAYDIWGHTVNIAARMEQNCDAGMINISETTYNLVKTDFKCTYRGCFEEKSEGKMNMYFVETSKIN